MATGATDEHRERRDDIALLAKFVNACIGRILASQCGRLFSDTFKDSIRELRGDEEARISQCVHSQLLRSGGR